MSTLQVAGFLDHSTVNGDGFRSVIFLSGCQHHCKGCHNPEMQSPTYGDSIEIADLLSRIKKNLPIIDGVTLSGGDPLEQASSVLYLIKSIKEMGLSIWLYTGYTYEELQNNALFMEVLLSVDVLVDGPFLLDLKSDHLKYRGSSNQRILQLYNGTIINELYPTK